MTKFLICTLSGVLLLGCDRLKLDESTKIQIQLPNAPASASAKLSDVSALGSSVPEPTGFTGTYPINCYMVAAGGPEEGMKTNKCFSRNGVNPNFAVRSVGTFVGAAPAGGTIGIDVPSGKDRSIYVVGFHAPNIALCRDFKTYGFPDNTLSNPYFLGEKTGLELKAGDTLELSIPINFAANQIIDCSGPDFPQNNNGSPSVEATKIAAEFFSSIGTAQCHPMRVHMYADSNGIKNYNATNSLAEVIALPAGSAPSYLSFYGNEADCVSATSSFTTLDWPAFTNEKVVWFRAISNSGGSPTPIGFSTVSNRLTYTENRTLFVTSPSVASRWAAQSSDSIGANSCREIIVNSTDSAGVAVASADSALNITLQDLNSATTPSPGYTIVDNCVSQNPVSFPPGTVTISGTKLRATFGLKMPATVVNDFQIYVNSSSQASGATTMYNLTPIANKLLFNIINPTGNAGFYVGDCFVSTMSMVDAAGSPATSATRTLTISPNFGSGANLKYSTTCTGTTATSPSINVGNSSGTYGIRIEGAGVTNYNLFNPFITNAAAGSFLALPSPGATAYYHGVVESLTPSSTVNSWASSSVTSITTMSMNFSTPATTSTVPLNIANGIELASTSYASLAGVGNATEITYVMKYKHANANATGDFLTVSNGTYTNNIGIDAGFYKIYGQTTSISVNDTEWSDIAITMSAGTCVIYVKTTSGSVQTDSKTCNNFSTQITNITVGSGVTGRVKTIIMYPVVKTVAEIYSSAGSLFDYMNVRYP